MFSSGVALEPISLLLLLTSLTSVVLTTKWLKAERETRCMRSSISRRGAAGRSLKGGSTVKLLRPSAYRRSLGRLLPIRRPLRVMPTQQSMKYTPPKVSSAAGIVSAAIADVDGDSRVQRVRDERGTGKVVVSPSVAKADFWCLGEELNAAVDAGAEWLHFSVQDGHMVPRVSLGSPVIKSLRHRLPDVVFDVKLGVINPELRIAEFAAAGADIISFHPEATTQPGAVVEMIRKSGCACGIVLNPSTPLETVQHLIDRVDVVVVMLVNPGHGGPKYTDAAVEKISGLLEMCQARGISQPPWISVDGGVDEASAPVFIAAGASVIVAGSSVFKAADKESVVRSLKARPKP